jgi:beta-lactamase regulating signal transducer with metallopeptidase domain/DNA gyrase inhibitor GyrI
VIDLLHQVALNWWQWMSAMFWQAGLLIVVIAVMDGLMRKWAWPQVRLALWLLVFVKLLIPPAWQLNTSLVSRLGPPLKARIFQMKQLEPTSDRPSLPGATLEVHDSAGKPVGPAGTSPQTVQQPVPDQRPVLTRTVFQPIWPLVAFAIWLAGILVFLVVLILKMSRLQRWHKLHDERTIPLWFHELLVQTAQRLNMSRLPAIIFAKDGATPAVYGLFKPILLLPKPYFDGLERKEAEHVLLHELCHIKRGDLILHAFCMVLSIVYWFNPLLLWAWRQMKHVREICCDLSVANVLREETIGYRDTLLSTARRLLTESVEPGLGMLGVFEEPFRLISRLRWLEKPTWKNQRQANLISILIALIMAVFFMPMADANPPAAADASGIHVFGNRNRSGSAKKNESDRRSIFTGIGLDVGTRSMFEIETAPAGWAILLPAKGALDQLPVLLEKLDNYMSVNGIKRLSPPIMRKYSSEEIVGLLETEWEAGYYIADSLAVKSPFKISRIPVRNVLNCHFTAAADFSGWNRKLSAWLYHNDYRTCVPQTIRWTDGIPQSNRPTPRFDVEMIIEKVVPGFPEIQVDIRSLPKRQVLVLPMQGDARQEDEAVERLRAYIKQIGVNTLDDIYIRYHNSPEWTPTEQLVWDVVVPIEHDYNVKAPMFTEWQQGGRVACVTYQGEHLDIPLAFWYSYVLNFTMNGYKVSGLPRKIFRERLADGQWKLELQWPVRN